MFIQGPTFISCPTSIPDSRVNETVLTEDPFIKYFNTLCARQTF